MWKRLFLVLLLLALLGGAYHTLPSSGRILHIPIQPLWAAWLTGGSGLEMQQTLLAGRQQALQVPTLRAALFEQALREQHAMLADQSAAAIMTDLQLSLLEQAFQGPPHDGRLEELLVRVLRSAATDPHLRPVLAEILAQALGPEESVQVNAMDRPPD